jgi:hypothetical protein
VHYCLHRQHVCDAKGLDKVKRLAHHYGGGRQSIHAFTNFGNFLGVFWGKKGFLEDQKLAPNTGKTQCFEPKTPPLSYRRLVSRTARAATAWAKRVPIHDQLERAELLALSQLRQRPPVQLQRRIPRRLGARAEL